MNSILAAELISKALEEKGLKSNFSVSETDYGVSCYFYFYKENDNYKLRVSDHSVENSYRLFNEEHIDFRSITENRAKAIAESIEFYLYPERFEMVRVAKMEIGSGRKYHIINGQLNERVRR